MLAETLRDMTDRLARELSAYRPTILLYGSSVLDDFRAGWSDIDILVLTDRPIAEDKARELVFLRQRLCEETGNALYRSFEGGMVSCEGFFSGAAEQTVYWGTSGQRLRQGYELDSFALAELATVGRLLLGADVRERFRYPSVERLRADVSHHLSAIRCYARETKPELQSCGWLLDIARGLYTLQTGCVIAKTRAGEWALEKRLSPDPETLERALRIRRDPSLFVRDEDIPVFCASLGPAVQRFADVLEVAFSR